MPLAPWHVQLFAPQDRIAQNTTASYTLQLTDEKGAALTLAQITTVTLHIFDLDAKPPTLIAGTWPRDVKNVPANGGVVSSSGVLSLTVSGTDNALITEAKSYELRRWSIDWTFMSGTKNQHVDVDRVLVNTLMVP